jgi:hypothetical protein
MPGTAAGYDGHNTQPRNAFSAMTIHLHLVHECSRRMWVNRSLRTGLPSGLAAKPVEQHTEPRLPPG